MTAVEWFFRWFNDNPEATHKDLAEAFEQAKAMEKENMIELIRFMRTNDKMGKSLEDLYQEFQYKKKL